MRVVADSSTLIALAAIDRLPLLQQRFTEGILVPQAVWREVVETGQGKPGAESVATAEWITRHPLQRRDFAALLQAELDEGEAETIALSREVGADLVLVDEKDARRVARRLGLRVLGTVGILIWAGRHGLIVSLRDELDRLRQEGGFRLSQDVYEEALRQVGESTSVTTQSRK